MTAVEWLELNLLGLISFDSEELRAKYKDRVAKAKEMERQEQENFAAWCIKKRVDFFDDTEIGETYTIDGFVSRYKMKELLEIYKKENEL